MRVLFIHQNTATNTPGWTNWAAISIYDAGAELPPLLDHWHSYLYVCLDNTECDKGVQAIIEFVKTVAPDVEGFFVNCQDGISKSAAVALWIAKQYGAPFNFGYQHYSEHIYKTLCDNSEIEPCFKLASSYDLLALPNAAPIHAPELVIENWSMIKIGKQSIHVVGNLNGKPLFTQKVVGYNDKSRVIDTLSKSYKLGYGKHGLPGLLHTKIIKSIAGVLKP